MRTVPSAAGASVSSSDRPDSCRGRWCGRRNQEQRLPGRTDRFQPPAAAIAFELDRAGIGHLGGQAGDVDDRQGLARRVRDEARLHLPVPPGQYCRPAKSRAGASACLTRNASAAPADDAELALAAIEGQQRRLRVLVCVNADAAAHRQPS